jgi:glycosyltransferase involved in cell wall biosynthesis
MPTKDKIKVSVIIPCYNLGAYLEEAVDSVLEQTFKDFEIIIVDDGSTDEETIRKIDEVAKKDKSISTFRTENQGLSATRNFGISKAKGEYIITLDADDKINPFYLEKAVKLLNSGKADIISPWIKCFGIDNTEIKNEEGEIEMLLAKNIITVASVYKKEIWEKVGGYDTNFLAFEDWDFWISAALKGYKWMAVHEFLFYYRKRPNSMRSEYTSDTERTVALLQRLYRKYEASYLKYLKEVLYYKDIEFRWNWEQLRNFQQVEKDFEKLRLDYSYAQRELEVARYKLDRNTMVLERINRLMDISKKILRKLVIPELMLRLAKKLFNSFNDFNTGTSLYARIAIQRKIPIKDPLVSVIIPCYNYGNYIQETLASILNQSWKRLEIIIVDDGSTDPETKQVLDKINTTSYRVPVKIYPQQNLGIVSARNNGISRARGKYVVALDADDKLDLSYIEKCVWVMETNPQIGVTYSNLKKFGKQDDVYKFGEFSVSRMREWNQVSTAAMFRKECWLETGGYKQVMKKGHEDWEFWLSIAEKGWDGKRIDEELMFYRVHSTDSLSNEALKIHSNLISRIKELHPDSLETIEGRYPKNFEKPLVDLTKFNYDDKIKEKIILLFAPCIIGGGAERLWSNYAAVMAKYGYKFLIITFENVTHTIYKELADNVVGIFNLPKFLPNELWMDFIKSQYHKYDIKATIISNALFAYDHIQEIRSFGNGILIDAVYNDSIHGLSDVSARNDEYIDLHLVNNPAIIDIYEKKYGLDRKKAYYLASPIDLELFNNNFDKNELRAKFQLKSTDFVICYIGRLSKEKNIDRLIASVSDLIIEIPSLAANLKLLIVGNGEIKEDLDKLVKELNVKENVVFMPFIDDPREIYAVSDLFALVSSIDGFPLSIQEALAMNIPVLATDVGAKKEVLTHGVNSFLIHKPDRFEIVKALKTIINERFFQDKNYRDTIKPYDREKLGKEFMKRIDLPLNK